MNFKVSRNQFLNELSKVSHAVSSKSPIYQLTGIKIEAKDDKIYFTGSDNELTIYSFIKKDPKEFVLDIYEEGSIVLSARYILDIVRKLDGDEVIIDVVDGNLTIIKSVNSLFKLKGLENDKNKYPMMDFDKPANTINLDSKTLKKLITQTIYATSEKEARPVLSGINIKVYKNTLEFTATDSYRLAKKKVIITDANDINVTVPKKCLDEISKMIENDNKVNFSISEKKVQFIIDNTIIQSRLIEGAFPETSRLIPTSFDYELVIESRVIIDAIDRSLLMKNEGSNNIKLSLSEECVEISSVNLEIGGSSKEIIEGASYTGKKFVISFSGKFAIDAIRAVESDLVKISFVGEMRPFIFRGIKDDSTTQLILPVKTLD